MKRFYLGLLAVMSAVSLFLPSAVNATNNFPTTAPFPDVIHLRKNCETLANCGTTTSEVQNWIANTRKPSASSPLLVEVGPGTYSRLACSSWGYTTFRGAGRAQTIFTSAGSSFGPSALLASNGCTEVEFQHMTFTATGFLSKGVAWNSNGNSRWLDVDVIGEYYGWYDTQGGKHYWFSSRIMATGAPGAFAKAYKTVAENWFYGSELLARATVALETVVALEQGGGVETHFYGSVIRVDASAPVTEATAISVGGGSVHIHGTGIDVISTVAGNAVVAMTAYNGAIIHANGAAYNLIPGAGGITTRIRMDTNPNTEVHAPYLWEAHSTPPNIISQDGADMAVVTTPGGTPKMVIYSTACASKWFDVGANACRP